MKRASLETRSGALVAEVELPEMKAWPDVVMHGRDVFVLHAQPDSTRAIYRRAWAYVVPPQWVT